MTTAINDLFASLFERTEIKENGCWEFIGSRFQFGHGRIKQKGITYRTHRLAYAFCFGEIPKGLFVLHSCDNPPCCNPDHLFLGTQLDNMQDMIARGRKVCARGYGNGMAKLKPTEVIEIKSLLKQSLTHQAIADGYNVDRGTITAINLNKNWSDL